MSMVKHHSFDIEYAARYGVIEAVIIEHFQFWLSHNMAIGQHMHDGRPWTYGTSAAIAESLPYLSPKQVRRALDKLRSDGVVLTGNYNKLPYDHTMWYSLSDEFLTKLDCSTCPNGRVTDDHMGATIPDTVTDTVITLSPDSQSGKSHEDADDTFDAFWNAYPKKVAKADAKKAWNKLKPDPTLFAAIIDALTAVKKSDSWTRDNGRYIPNPATWLNGRRWEDEQTEAQQSPPEERKPRYRRL